MKGSVFCCIQAIICHALGGQVPQKEDEDDNEDDDERNGSNCLLDWRIKLDLCCYLSATTPSLSCLAVVAGDTYHSLDNDWTGICILWVSISLLDSSGQQDGGYCTMGLLQLSELQRNRRLPSKPSPPHTHTQQDGRMNGCCIWN